MQQVNAQNRLDWVKQIGSTDNESGRAIAVDDAGNVYTTGTFKGTIDFDPGPGVVNLTAAGAGDIFVVKMDASGNLIWAKSWGGVAPAGIDQGWDIAVDKGNVYITGQLYGNGRVDFDPSPAPADTFFLQGTNLVIDAFISKLDTSGKFVWAKLWGGNYTEIPIGIAIGPEGSVYTTGWIVSNGAAYKSDFNPSRNPADTFFLYMQAQTVSGGNYDIFILKLDASGNFVWAKSIGSTDADQSAAIAVDPTGNAYITGSFKGKADFNTSPAPADTFYLTSFGLRDAFVAKLDVSGNLVWARQLGGEEDDKGADIAVDILGNVLTIGGYKLNADFDPSPIISHILSSISTSTFISKLDAAGNFVWAKSIISGYDDGSIAVDLSGNVYTTGRFKGTIDMDPGPGALNFTTPTAGFSSSDVDIFISKLNFNGNFEWGIQCGGINGDQGNAIAVGKVNREVYVTGVFSDYANFNAGTDTTYLTSSMNAANTAYSPDMFVYKLLQQSCKTASAIAASACESYTYNGNTYTNSGIYTHMFTNAGGCDSTVVLTVTINKNATSLYATACGSYTLNGQTYTTSGVYTQTLMNKAGCDSVLTLNLTINPVKSTAVTATACNTYTFNGQTYTASGAYNHTFPGASGCDSVVTLNLTITTPTSDRITMTACDSTTINSQVYKTTGTFTQVLQNAAGCDSTLTIDLTINPSPELSIIKTGKTLTSSLAPNYQWIDCSNGNIPVTGATQKSFTPQANGSFAVVSIGAGGCSDTSDCVSVTVSIEDIDDVNGIHTYPNPSHGIVYLRSDDGLSDASIKVINMKGQVLIGHNNVNGYTFTIDISSYASGVYILEILQEKKVAKIKLVKE